MKKKLNHNGVLLEFDVSYDVKVGDEVYNITHGGGEHPEQFDIDDPAMMLDLQHSISRSHQCRTSHGYGPKDHYFKLLPGWDKIIKDAEEKDS